ncbi:MAG: carboxylesterase/lipase family protein [Pleomorphochaeta sp.]
MDNNLKFVLNRENPIVETTYGRIRGFIEDSTYTFYGIKYATSKRFQAPKKCEKFEGIKDAISYGYVCPLPKQTKISNEVLVPHRYWISDEDCLNLNIWTQSIDKEKKRAVMVWLHGGAFTNGSSIEQIAYDGKNLSKLGDVVVVSINHRLNVLGYLNLSDYGEKYNNSGNRGQEDIIASLKWIKDNIINFGGDPNNVTLFGQSGGGMKIAALMQTPSSEGLFHKGIIQSGVVDDDSAFRKNESKDLINALLDELDLSEKEIEKLETVEYEKLIKAYQKASDKVNHRNGFLKLGAPLENDWYLGEGRFNKFSDHSKTIALMIGTTFGEFNFESSVARNNISEVEIKEKLVNLFGLSKDIDKLVALFRKTYPSRDLADLLDFDETFRYPTKHYISEFSKVMKAPLYSYLLNFDFEYEGGKPAWHCSDIPFVFNNMEKVPLYNTKETIELGKIMSLAWINFAKSGNPNHENMVNWPKCEKEIEYTIIFDKKCEVKVNFDDELVNLHHKLTLSKVIKEKNIIH